MRALVWKELRENVKWALLAMAALGVAEMYGLYHNDTLYAQGDYMQTGITICRTNFLMVTTFGSPIVGFLLGLLQILPELRRDQWAALLHRPVPRTTIFMGKAAAGLLLYALATLPPFFLSVWLAATPGHFPEPFVPGMMQPGIADIFTGVIFYFAALALALQRDRWSVLRAFPLMAAFHAACFVNAATYFRVAIEAAAAMGLLLFIAAWGTMLHQENNGARPWLARLAFLVMVLYGARGFGDIATSIIEKLGPGKHSRFYTYEITDKGEPLSETYIDDVCTSVLDLNGKPPSDIDYQPARIRSHVRYLNGFSSCIGDSHGWKFQPYVRSYREYSAYLWELRVEGFDQWFYLQDPANSLISCNFRQKKPVERFDQSGFHPASANPQPFTPETTWADIDDFQHIAVWNGKQLNYVSLTQRQLAPLPLPGAGPVFGLGTAFAQDNRGNVSVFGAALKDRLAVYNAAGAPVTALPYHHDVDRWGQLRMGLSGALDRFYLWYEPSAWIDGKTRATMPSYFEELDRQGNVLRSWTLPPLPPNYSGHSFGYLLAEHLQSPALFFGNIAYQKIGALLGSTRLRGALDKAFGSERGVTRETILYISLISLALSAVTLLWARTSQFSWPQAIGWSVFVLFFNLAGFITFRLASDWPRAVSCPRCKRPRLIRDQSCPHCGAAWPDPPRVETEIFDGAAATAAPAAA